VDLNKEKKKKKWTNLWFK